MCGEMKLTHIYTLFSVAFNNAKLTGVVQIDGALCKVSKAIPQPLILHIHRQTSHSSSVESPQLLLRKTATE